MDATPLEELILRGSTDPASRPQLIEALLASKIAVPLNKGLKDGALPPDFKPMTLNSPHGYPVLAVFTTPQKITPWLKEQPDFQHSLVTDFTWAIDITRPPFGIAVNPGYQHSVLLSPSEVEALRSTT